jgi:hypothetical protein
MTQGERITKIETQLCFINETTGRIEGMLSTHIQTEQEYLTKKEAKKSYAGVWVESWVKGAVFSIAIGALVAIIISQI